MLERFDRRARIAVVLAQEEAREMHAGEINPGHILLGVLKSAEPGLATLLARHGLTAEALRERLLADEAPLTDDDAEALRSIGIDLDEVRDRITKTFGEDAFRRARRDDRDRRRWGRRIPFQRSAKKVLELGLREAIAHQDNWIGCEHIVLGILRGRDQVAASVLTEHVDADQLRTEVIALLEDAA